MNGIEFLKALARRVRAEPALGGVLHDRNRHVVHRAGDRARRPGIHHEAVRRGYPARQVRPGRPAVIVALRPAPAGCRGAGAGRARAWCATIRAAIRGAIARMLESDPAVRVVARAANGAGGGGRAGAARRSTCVVLDIEMPVLDGLAALPLLLRADPGPAGDHGLHPDHARRRHRDARAAAGRRRLRAEALAVGHRRRQFPHRTAREGEGPGAAAPARRERPAARPPPPAASPRCRAGRPQRAAAAGDRQLHRRAAGAVHADTGARARTCRFRW